MFPGSGAVIYRNEDGEVLGWDYPDNEPFADWCDFCGFSHGGPCPDDEEEDEY